MIRPSRAANWCATSSCVAMPATCTRESRSPLKCRVFERIPRLMRCRLLRSWRSSPSRRSWCGSRSKSWRRRVRRRLSCSAPGSERSSAAGREEERRLVDIANAHGILLIGPNCSGIVSHAHAGKFSGVPPVSTQGRNRLPQRLRRNRRLPLRVGRPVAVFSSTRCSMSATRRRRE